MISKLNKPLRISPSGVRLFRECPFRYALDYVDRLPQEQRLSSSTLELGNAVHKALAQFILQGGWKTNSLDDLIAMLTSHWTENASSRTEEGFINFMNAKDMVSAFYQTPYPEGNAHQEIGIERNVSWSKGYRGIRATGKMDRVCFHSGDLLEIIDYKTGRRMLDVAQLPNDIQALFYHTLAADAFRCFSPRCIRITFLYLSSGVPVSIEYRKEDFLSKWHAIEETACEVRMALQKKEMGLQLQEAFPSRQGTQCLTCPTRLYCKNSFEHLVWEKEVSNGCGI